MRSKCLSVLALTTALATGFCGAASAAALLTSHVPSAVAGRSVALRRPRRSVHADAHAGRPADAQQARAEGAARRALRSVEPALSPLAVGRRLHQALRADAEGLRHRDQVLPRPGPQRDQNRAQPLPLPGRRQGRRRRARAARLAQSLQAPDAEPQLHGAGPRAHARPERAGAAHHAAGQFRAALFQGGQADRRGRAHRAGTGSGPAATISAAICARPITAPARRPSLPARANPSA